MSISPPAPHPLCLSIILFGSRFADLVFTAWSSPRCHTATYGVPLSKAYEMDCQRPLRRPHMGDAPIIEQKAGSVPQTTDIPHVIDLDRYDESPAAACVAPGISQPKLTKLIREAKVRSINIGRTRLIEKAADVRRMATAAR
jgi:hypothetical protein